MASYNSKFITGDKLKPILQDVYAEINKTSTNASTEITNALNTAKTYAENKSTEALNSAKAYTDNVGSTTLSSAKSYADNVGSSTLTAAKKYTDDEVSAALDTSTEYTNDEVAKSLASAKEYADGVGSSTLNSAKSYADNVGSTTLSSAKSYADNVGSNTLSSANSYTDTSIENLVDNAPTDANTLKKLNDRINTNVQSISDLSNVVDTKATDADLTAHKNDKSNPHSVTKAQVGLGNADNTADAVKDVRSATKLATTHSIFGQDFDGTADVSGQATVDGIYQSDNTKRYLRSAIQIRENGLVGNSQSDIGYGPAIGFNWVGHNGGTLVMGTNGTFYLKTKDWTRATLDANIIGNLTGNITGDVTGNITGDIKGNVTGNLTGTATNATNDSLGQKIDTTYIKGLSVSGRVITYTRGDDTIGTITTQDTTYPVFTGATSSTAGTTGLVPAPGSGDNLKFLRADGNWVVPTDTNTWRPIEDVLTSTSTVNSLTANQGRVLKELIESKATEAKNYTDSVGSSTLSSAKTYADGVGSDTLDSAKSYANGVGTTTLNSAKEYSDSNVKTLLGGASTDSNTLKKLEDKISSLTNSSATDADLTAHKNDKSNPHSVTKAQVGLGNADNTADVDKNVLSATKLTTARSIFGQTFNGTANVAGRGTFYGAYKESPADFYKYSAIELRECDNVLNTQSSINYAPRIAFHWGQRTAGTMIFHSDGNFYLREIDGDTRATLDANIIGNVSGNSSTATKLATARNIQVNLASTSATSFDGSANVTPGVTGVLGVANGGTGKTTGVDAANYFLNSLSVGSSNPILSDYYIAQYAGGGTTTTTYHRKPLSALWNTFNAEAAKVYLPLSGGTMTGNISFKGTSGTTHTMITFKSGADVNGDGIIIGGGGLTVIGSGESAEIVASQFGGDDENMRIASDGAIYFYSNMQNGWDSRKTATFSASGVFSAPSFSGPLSGNASSASKLETSRTIALTGSVTGSGTFDGSGDLTINTTTNHTHDYLPLSGGTMTGNLNFNQSGILRYISWIDATYQQRIQITDDSTADTAVFTFQQSSNSGSSWSDLFTIKDNGEVVATKFTGALNGNATSASSCSGNAGSATKLTSSAGSATNPVYFSDGKPVACTYSLNKTVPSNAVFTDYQVTQNNTTTEANYRIIFSANANDNSETSTVRKSTKFLANPSTGVITAPTFKGALDGNAGSATKLTSSAGSATNPVYFSDGKPVACTYSLNKTVPADAKFTDTNTHYTTHLYAGTSSGVANAATTNGNTYLILTDDSTARNRIKIAGSGATSVASDANGAITISSTNTTYSAATSSAAGLMPAADKAKLDSIGDIITITKTLTITTEWQDTGIYGNAIPNNGSYIVQVSGMSSSATDTWNEIWTGFMSWFTAGTNSLEMDEIVLHKAGHASNDNTIYLRTIRSNVTGSVPYLRLQICASTDFSETSVTFKFRKLI